MVSSVARTYIRAFSVYWNFEKTKILGARRDRLPNENVPLVWGAKFDFIGAHVGRWFITPRI